jgi:hypothetical protein
MRDTDQTDQKIDELKRAIYDRLSPRRKKFIERIGFDKWDPFQKPKDPIEWRTDVTNRTAQQLASKFLQEGTEQEPSSAYSRGVTEFCVGLVNNDERVRGVYEFCVWYEKLLEREGKLQRFKEQLDT